MYDASKIVAGLAVFVVLATSPLWYNALSNASPAAPELQRPTNGSTECVEATEYMRSNHMKLLNQWRDTVVRANQRTYISGLTGKEYEMSLQKTCMNCHSNKAQFCDACHTYSAVTPYCWECHVIPEEGQ
jgi:ribosome modulation factor